MYRYIYTYIYIYIHIYIRSTPGDPTPWMHTARRTRLSLSRAAYAAMIGQSSPWRPVRPPLLGRSWPTRGWKSRRGRACPTSPRAACSRYVQTLLNAVTTLQLICVYLDMSRYI